MQESGFFRQAEQIANHYTKLANLAFNLHQAIRIPQTSEKTEHLRMDFIRHIVETIQEAHFEDFGIELKWEGDLITKRIEDLQKRVVDKLAEQIFKE